MIHGGGHHNTHHSETAPLDVAAIPTGHLSKTFLEYELESRRHNADLLELLAENNTRGCTRDSVHRNLGVWVADHLRVSRREASNMVSIAVLAFSDHPVLGARYRSGMLNMQHLRQFLKIWNRPELRPALERDLDFLIGCCTRRWPEALGLFRAWTEAVDPGDPNDEAAKAHNKRSFTFGRTGHQLLGELNTTTAMFAVLEPGLQAKVDELFEADWAEARARVGDAACSTDLLRNDTQRWHDAFIELTLRGIGADPATTNAVANIVVDADTLEDEAEQRDHASSGGAVGPRSTADAVARAKTYRCETLSGMPISPADALDFALAGHVRLFRMNAATDDFTASSKARLFTGAKRTGIQIRDRYCQGPGCDTAASKCQADHTIRYTDGGPTIPTNGKARCGPCHRHKTRLELLGLWPPAS